MRCELVWSSQTFTTDRHAGWKGSLWHFPRVAIKLNQSRSGFARLLVNAFERDLGGWGSLTVARVTPNAIVFRSQFLKLRIPGETLVTPSARG